MRDTVDVDWVATWSCPKCGNQCDEHDYDIDFSDATNDIECKELVDKGGYDLEACGYQYSICR